LSWKGNFPVGTKIDRGEKFKGSQKNCRLQNFIRSPENCLPKKIYAAKIVDLRLREIFPVHSKKLSV